MSDLHESHPPKLTTSTQASSKATVEAAVDAGLRSYMLGIYNKVALGLVLAAGLAHVTATVPTIRALLFRTAARDGAAPLVGLTGAGVVIAFSPVFLLLLSGPLLRRPTALSTGLLYWSLVSLIGASLGLLLLTFTSGSIATTLAVSAAAFGGLSLMGYATRRDLSGLRGFLMMGLIGLVVALVLNIALQSPAIAYVANMAGVLIFAGLIAYDTQRLKMAYHLLGGDQADMSVATNYGALSLFINFINLFQFLLLMMSGERR
jgi:FtsH-binding integral membrane protein